MDGKRCMERLIMSKLRTLEIAEECFLHGGENASLFRDLARKAHALHEEMESALSRLKSKHEAEDAEVNAMYRDHHRRRAERLKREIGQG